MDKTELMKEIEELLKNDETIQYRIDTETIKGREIFRIYFDFRNFLIYLAFFYRAFAFGGIRQIAIF